MYLHLGKETAVRTADIVGIFDIDKTTVAKNTKIFLAIAQKQKRVVNTSEELPKSFVITKRKAKETVYISQLSPATLKGRV